MCGPSSTRVVVNSVRGLDVEPREVEKQQPHFGDEGEDREGQEDVFHVHGDQHMQDSMRDNRRRSKHVVDLVHQELHGQRAQEPEKENGDQDGNPLHIHGIQLLRGRAVVEMRHLYSVPTDGDVRSFGHTCC